MTGNLGAPRAQGGVGRFLGAADNGHLVGARHLRQQVPDALAGGGNGSLCRVESGGQQQTARIVSFGNLYGKRQPFQGRLETIPVGAAKLPQFVRKLEILGR